MDPLDWVNGLKLGLLAGAAIVSIVLTPPVEPTGTELRDRVPEFGAGYASPSVRRVARWIVADGDNGRAPFAIVDKPDARLYVFDHRGRLRGTSQVLLGSARGDDTVPGIGQRPIQLVRPDERTTPAGRFMATPGRNARDEDVIWIDYDAAVSMHRVRLTQPAEHRLERLASPRAADRRISYGCINLPVAFFDEIVWQMFGTRGGIVYVLPEVRSIEWTFPGMRRFEARANPTLAQGAQASGPAAPVFEETAANPGRRASTPTRAPPSA
ncbi:MAG TPA: hypothetical protein VLE94_00770 [Burkholderiaceae bacterium]|nr:hypothetical protein [Burkholderiaceae bacterium]